MTRRVNRVIDALVNVHFGETAKQPEFMLKVRDDYFKGPQALYDQVELPALLDEMDEHGVDKAILMDNLVKDAGCHHCRFCKRLTQTMMVKFPVTKEPMLLKHLSRLIKTVMAS